MVPCGFSTDQSSESHGSWVGPVHDGSWVGPVHDGSWVGPVHDESWVGPVHDGSWVGPVHVESILLREVYPLTPKIQNLI